MDESVHHKVSDYYGKVLSTKNDLKTTACCSTGKISSYIKEPLDLIEEEIQTKFYGCGAPIPFVLEGMKVLDLGCGTGRDCFIISYYVGVTGEVVGVDMTDNQIGIANKYVNIQTQKFGYDKPNVRFIKGYIEDLTVLDLPDNYFDLVISNCVVNLSPDKGSVLREAFRVLKQGGEFFFSDVYVDRRLPDWCREDFILLGECLGGALYWKDFERLAKTTGFLDPRVVQSSNIDLMDKETIDKVGFAHFYSLTYRLLKLSHLEDACEDFGQSAIYNGGIEHSVHQFVLDNHHVFEKNKPVRVCSNTARMLQWTRFSKYFIITGDTTTHYGLFEGCGEESVIKNIDTGGCC